MGAKRRNGKTPLSSSSAKPRLRINHEHDDSGLRAKIGKCSCEETATIDCPVHYMWALDALMFKNKGIK